MKKIYLLGILVVMLSGCDHFLDRTPYDNMDEDIVFEKLEHVQGALYGVYDAISHENYYGRQVYAYEAAKGPDFYVNSGTGNRFERENGYQESSSSGGFAIDTWEQLYGVVKATTNIIGRIDNVPGNEEEKKRIKGEAHALRGLTYFDLMRMFAYPPIFSCPGGAKYEDKYKKGVPVVLTIEELNSVITTPIGRSDAATCYEKILHELNQAKTCLKGMPVKQGEISYYAVCALLSRVYLYLGKWEEAITEGELALGGKSKMMDYSEYKTNYYKPFCKENIWELAYTATDNLSTAALNYIIRYPTIDNPEDPKDGKVSAKQGYAANSINSLWMNIVKKDAKDVRRYLNCDNRKGKGCRRYIGDPTHYQHNIPVVCLAEVYLNLAEAYAESSRPNGLKTALDYMNEVHEARTDETFEGGLLTKQELIDAILLERRKELVLLGHTYWDCFRRAIPFKRERKGCVTAANENIDYTLPQVVYPIPENEMDANPNIRGEQNPGYAPYQ